MKVPVVVLMLLSISLLCWNPVMSSSGFNPSDEQYVPHELIVCFRENVPVPQRSLFDGEVALTSNRVLTQLRQTLGLMAVERLIPDDVPRLKQEISTAGPPPKPAGWPPTPDEIAALFHYFGQDRTFLLRFSQPIDPPRMAEQLMRDYPELIEYAEPNLIRHLDRTPNDTQFRLQWHLFHNISDPTRRADVRAPEAWDITVGSTEVAIAVLDTGAESTHQDLASKLMAGRGFTGGSTTNDTVGHGTAVSGAAAAITDNMFGVAGVCWNCQILPVRVCGPNGCPVSAIFSGINYAVNQASRGVRVINMSFGGEGTSSSERAALASANTVGILCVAAAGNGDDDGNPLDNDETPHFPSNYSAELPNVIGVAATASRANRLASFSNFGKMTVTLAAPGTGIWTTFPTNPNLEINNTNGVGSISGTSVAAPIVSGIAGLIYSQFPGITASQVRARLEGSVDQFPELMDKVVTGGRVNALRALQLDDIAPAAITNLRVHTGKAQPAALTWTATGDDGRQGQAVFYEVLYSPREITPDNFGQASKASAAPFPQAAGATESWMIQGVPRGTYFFSIRAIDNVGNSSLSNSVRVPVN
jgi:subtilisin family serine protease